MTTREVELIIKLRPQLPLDRQAAQVAANADVLSDERLAIHSGVPTPSLLVNNGRQIPP
jgi:hypothetical protein